MSSMISQILGAIERQLDDRLNSFETALPGTVSNVRPDGRVDVTPSIRKMVTNGVIENYDKPILGVPVMQIGFSGFSFDLELKNGDSVVLLFFSRDSSQWKKRKWGQSDPRAPFANDVNNCVAIPFVRPDSDAKPVIKIDRNGIVTFDSDKVMFKGRVVVDGPVISKEDVFVETSEGMGVSLKSHSHQTAVGPSTPPQPPTLNPYMEVVYQEVEVVD